MPTRDTAPIGAPCWIDLMTSDTERSRAFYCELFGWTAEQPAEEFGGYFYFSSDGVRVAGCMASRPRPRRLDPDGCRGHPYGRLAVAADPTGARFKLVAANEAMPGLNS